MKASVARICEFWKSRQFLQHFVVWKSYPDVSFSSHVYSKNNLALYWNRQLSGSASWFHIVSFFTFILHEVKKEVKILSWNPTCSSNPSFVWFVKISAEKKRKWRLWGDRACLFLQRLVQKFCIQGTFPSGRPIRLNSLCTSGWVSCRTNTRNWRDFLCWKSCPGFWFAQSICSTTKIGLWVFWHMPVSAQTGFSVRDPTFFPVSLQRRPEHWTKNVCYLVDCGKNKHNNTSTKQKYQNKN